MTPLVHEQSPYIGPRPFERHDKLRFFGRIREVEELASRVVVHSTMVLYAPTGAGKTSLINAGLIPLLGDKGYEVLPIARVQGPITGIDPEKVRNIFAFQTLLAWAGDVAAPQQLAELSLRDFLRERKHQADDEGQPVLHVAIIDQFEELFGSYPDRWQDRRAFFEQTRDALEADPLLHIVLALREEYLGELGAYAGLLPGKLRARYRLEPLRGDKALEAVRGPLECTGRVFAADVAEILVNELMEIPVVTATGTMRVRGEFVEPVQLQVVCQSLWNELPADVTVITAEAIQAFGDVSQALERFLEQSLQTVVRQTGVREGSLRNWFRNVLLTPAGTRGTVYRAEHETGGMPNAVVDALVNLHLIHGEERGGARWYELTHDRFIKTILNSNQRWLASRSGADAIRQRLEASAAAWRRAGRGENYLLNEEELTEAKRWLSNPDADELGYSDAVVALVQASARSKQVQRLRLRLTALIILVCLVVGLMVLVLVQYKRLKQLEERIRRHDVSAQTMAPVDIGSAKAC